MSLDANFFATNKINKAEVEKIKKQKSCDHEYWITRCSICDKILGSDKQKNIDIEEDLYNDNYDPKTTTIHINKIPYHLSSIYLDKDQQTNEKVASYTFEDITILKGQAKILLSDPFEDITKQVIISTGERLRLRKNQRYLVKTVRHGVLLTITKINV